MSRQQATARVEKLEIWSKTRRVLDYDADPETSGRPLMVLLGGATLALLALAFMIMVAYRTWSLEENGANRAYVSLSLLFAVHTIGVYLFAYGYELYDRNRALRLTAMIALVSFGAIAAFIAAILLMMRARDVATTGASLLSLDETPLLAGEAGAFFPMSAPLTPSLGRFEKPAETPQPFAITCIGCQRDFEPAPPRAVCPHCGRENVRAG